MKTSSKSIFAILCAFAVLFSVLIVPASALVVNHEEVVQSWSFAGKGFNDSEVNVITNDYWDNTACKVTRTVENGVYTVAAKTGETMNANTPIRIYFKLNESLIAGEKYTFTLNAYSPSGSRLERGASVFYATSVQHDSNIYINADHPLVPSAAGAVGTVSKDAQTILSTSTDATIDFTFTATAEMVANGYIGFAAKVVSGVTGSYCFKGAEISRKNHVNLLDENGNILAGEWSFTGKGFNDSDVNVISNDYWDNTACKVTRSITNGVYSAVAKYEEQNMWNAPFRVYFRLDENLIAGKEYTLNLNAYSNQGNTFFKAGSSVFYNSTTYHDSNISVGYNGGHALVPSTAIGTVTKSSGISLPTTEDGILTYTFTATAEMVAGGYIGFATQLADDAKGAFCVKGATLIGDNVTSLVDYDFDSEGVREETFMAMQSGTDASYGASNSLNGAQTGVDAYTATAGTYSGKTAIKKYQHQLILAVPTLDENDEGRAVVLEENTEYIVDLTATCAYHGGNVYLYAGDPESFDSDADEGVLLIKNAGSIEGGLNSPETKQFVFTTAGSSIDFSTYSQLVVVIRPVDTTQGNITLCYKLAVSKRNKGIRMNTAPVAQSVRYNKITFADNDFATYALYDSENEEWVELEGNISAMLDYDTTYTFKVKYADDGRYLASDYGQTVTLKTLKFGDVNADDAVNILDLIRLKKSSAELSTDDIYDLDFDEEVGGNDLICLTAVLLAN